VYPLTLSNSIHLSIAFHLCLHLIATTALILPSSPGLSLSYSVSLRSSITRQTSHLSNPLPHLSTQSPLISHPFGMAHLCLIGIGGNVIARCYVQRASIPVLCHPFGLPHPSMRQVVGNYASRLQIQVIGYILCHSVVVCESASAASYAIPLDEHSNPKAGFS
jgi:hypothetical protein